MQLFRTKAWDRRGFVADFVGRTREEVVAEPSLAWMLEKEQQIGATLGITLDIVWVAASDWPADLDNGVEAQRGAPERTSPPET